MKSFLWRESSPSWNRTLNRSKRPRAVLWANHRPLELIFQRLILIFYFLFGSIFLIFNLGTNSTNSDQLVTADLTKIFSVKWNSINLSPFTVIRSWPHFGGLLQERRTKKLCRIWTGVFWNRGPEMTCAPSYGRVWCTTFLTEKA